MALTDTDSMRAYLIAKGIDVVSVETLSGGVANFLFRVTTSDQRTLVVKHAEPYVKLAPHLPFPTSRMRNESNILEFMSEFEERESYVTVPRVESYDPEAHVLVMSAEGPQNLKDAYTDPKIDIETVGRRLGIWLGIFHERVKRMEMNQGPINDPVVNTMCRTSYNGLEKVAEKYGFDLEVCRQVKDEFGSRLSKRHEGCCHGDFWPGNVLLKDSCTSASKDEFDIAIVDWEMIRMGSNATDVGQFAAEAILLDRTRGKRGLLRGFLEGYKSKRDWHEKSWTKQAGVHTAVHLMYWPTRVSWGDEQETRGIITLGWELLQKTLEERQDWVKGEGLEELFEELM